MVKDSLLVRILFSHGNYRDFWFINIKQKNIKIIFNSSFYFHHKYLFFIVICLMKSNKFLGNDICSKVND